MLAIGIVVDDAIVVVENVERLIRQGLPPREAARQAMREVSGALIAIALVLAAVFIPTAFITGISGEFYRQFAITIAASTAFSAVNSLTLSPAVAAILFSSQETQDSTRPRQASLTINFIPARPRFFKCRRKPLQPALSSFAPSATPRILRYPVDDTPVATRTETFLTSPTQVRFNTMPSR